LRRKGGGEGGEWAGVLRGLMRGLTDVQNTVSTLCEDNMSSLEYLIDQSKVKERRMDVEMVSA